MKISMTHPKAASGTVDLIGSPLKLNETPVDYRLAPPVCGQHTNQILHELLHLTDEEIATLRAKKIV
jgi:crotonobetainyl-CoA:carnitine CoA-transferase CaiB-like acyl-CoA transferase